MTTGTKDRKTGTMKPNTYTTINRFIKSTKA